MDIFARILIFKKIALHIIYLEDGVFWSTLGPPPPSSGSPDFDPHLRGRVIIISPPPTGLG